MELLLLLPRLLLLLQLLRLPRKMSLSERTQSARVYAAEDLRQLRTARCMRA